MRALRPQKPAKEGARTLGTPPGTGSRGERRAAQQSLRCGFRELWLREEERLHSIPNPLAIRCSCSVLAGFRLWERSAKRVDVEWPPQNPPQSIFLQVVDKNSRRIMLGEERDAREARQGNVWSCTVKGGGGMQPHSQERGLGVRGSGDARPRRK